MNPRAPKQWSLTKQETITSFEAWRQNLQYILSLDRNFAGFLADGVTWSKNPLAALVAVSRTTPNPSLKLPVKQLNKSVLILN